MTKVQELAGLFKNSAGNKQVMKDGQKEIFDEIVTRRHPRNAILCYTRYGKSMTIAQAVLVRAVLFPETWIFVGPTELQASILMKHLIKHLFDSKRFYSQLAIDMPMERLKRQRRQDRLTFRRGGEVYILTADVRNTRRLGALIGQGAPNVILDESPLIPDKTEAMVTRMLADSADNFLVKVGNAFENNHFKRAVRSEKYHKIIVDCYQGLKESEDLPYAEGKLTQETIDEEKGKPFFEQLWECKFPDTSLTDERGYTPIITEREVLEAFKRKADTSGTPDLGLDVAKGGDWNVFYARWPRYAKMLEKNKDKDTMAQVGKLRTYRDELKNGEEYPVSFVDGIGIGAGVVDRAREMNLPVVDVIAGAEAQDKEKFANLKAEAYWEMAAWIRKNALEPNDELLRQITEIRYKEDSEKRVKIEPKIDYVKRMGHSPDEAEALMTTFAPRDEEPELMIL